MEPRIVDDRTSGLVAVILDVEHAAVEGQSVVARDVEDDARGLEGDVPEARARLDRELAGQKVEESQQLSDVLASRERTLKAAGPLRGISRKRPRRRRDDSLEEGSRAADVHVPLVWAEG